MSPPWMRVELSAEEDQTLQELSRATTVPTRPRERAQALRLSHRGWKPEQIAEYFGWKVGTARVTIHRWNRRLHSKEQITVIVQDNGSNHTSHAVQSCIPRWQAMGLFFFQLPPYCSEMNPIEIEWRQIKANGIRGRMFDDEYDLALAVISSVRQRGQVSGYRAERFNFKTIASFAPLFLPRDIPLFI